MSDKTHIEWTDATWNPVTGCSVVSPGCTNCYAMRLAGTRLQHHYSRAGLTTASKAGPVWNGQVRYNPDWLDHPLRWKSPRRIFVCAHGDLFHENVPDEWIDLVFAVMALCPRHTFQVLTKRADRMRDYVKARSHSWVLALSHAINDAGLGEWADRPGRKTPQWPLANVHLGVSVEDQARAEERIPTLLETPAAIRWISAEPLLGPVDLEACAAIEWNHGGPILDAAGGQEDFVEPHVTRKLDWVVVGGESGPGSRPMHPVWARSLRDQCAAAGVPFLFKQWGEWTPGENVERRTGTVTVARYDHDRWFTALEDLARTDGHVDDEPDLYLVGKRQAGRTLDGVIHDAYPGSDA